MPKCSLCGMEFTGSEDLEEYGFTVHNFTDKESSLLRKAGEVEKARKRSRGPYRKSHAA